MSVSHSVKFLSLALLVVLAFAFADLIPYEVRSLSYTLSISIKEVLMFAMPFIVFSIVFHPISQLKGDKAIKTILLLFGIVTVSNSASVGVAHFLGVYLVSSATREIVSQTANAHTLREVYSFHLPYIIGNAHALAAGFFCGAVLPRIFGERVVRVSGLISNINMFILEKVLAPLLPLFILGLVFKMESDQVLGILWENAEVVFYIFTAASTYIILLYILGSGFSLRLAASRITNMLPAVLMGFGTMSSLVTMPMILSASKKNCSDQGMIDVVVPASLNIHLVGDCFFVIVLALMISSVFGTEAISTADYLCFLAYFVLLKFAEVAVAGAGLVVMLPTIEQYLHFSPTMLSMIATMYILFDPAITSMNVFGNGAFATLFLRVHRMIFSAQRHSNQL